LAIHDQQSHTCALIETSHKLTAYKAPWEWG